jgi:hypothetical protein
MHNGDLPVKVHKGNVSAAWSMGNICETLNEESDEDQWTSTGQRQQECNASQMVRAERRHPMFGCLTFLAPAITIRR